MKNLLVASYFFLTFSFIGQKLVAQETFPTNGVLDSRDGMYAFINATIHKADGSVIENGSLLIKNGKIVSVGSGSSANKDAVVIDVAGNHIYPSFVESFGNYGMPEVKRKDRNSRNGMQQMLSSKDGPYSWNEALKTEISAIEKFEVNSKSAKEWLKLGFGTVNSHNMDGISRGTSVLCLLGDEKAHNMIIKEKAAHHLSFSKGTSTQAYPGSLMGGIALLRQTYLDGLWYENYGKKEQINLSLERWNAVQDLPQIFAVGNKLEILRANEIAKEYGKKYIFRSTGDAYQRLDAIKNTNSTLILTLNFPEAYDLEDPLDAQLVAFEDLKHWEMAPKNAYFLDEAGIEFVFSTDGLKDKKKFLPNIRKTIKYGLSEKTALAALTSRPAKMLGVSDKVGDLKNGLIANFFICSENIFNEKSKILHNWVNGKPHVFEALEKEDLSGKYQLNIDNKTYQLEVSGKAGQQEMKIVVNDSTNVKVNHTIKNGLLSLSFIPHEEEKMLRLNSPLSAWKGNAVLADGTWSNWEAKRIGEVESKSKDKKKKGEDTKEEVTTSAITYPFLPFGWTEKPKAESYLLKNATLWTNESDGIIENTDILIKNGKISAIGTDLSPGGAIEIDATGKHITSGIIDEHSHIAISRGVNECTQASTAEVSIAHVVNSDDINIYRQLSGGVTTAQLLHGSCNPIGGQAALIKLRWGSEPEEMKFEGSDGFIKFALGENVKKSRSSRNNRFPDSRMGVEQVYKDHFSRALDYKKRKQSGDASLRKDLEMETLVDILDSKRFITCHSYVQSEINMLMHVAEEFDFKVNTFTHILEGYKVADKMAAHGAGGSSFSDWWAYKYEVIDAIPQNGEIMHNEGVVVAFNSDDAEMARRLNQEAAKAVKYGKISEEEAWKFVTLNPAKLLHIDNQVGSLKVGKDADIVLWSDHPMSIYSKAEMTFIDGIKYFDRSVDLILREELKQERARLVQKSLTAKSKGAKTQGVKGKIRKHYHCDDDHDEMW